MNTVTNNYLSRAETWLFITILVYFLMNGAQIFETVVIVPAWTSSPPDSLQMLKRIDLKTFWIAIHSIHEIIFIVAIICCWKLDIRNWLLILFAIHFAVRIWTLTYFAPHIMEFQEITTSTTIGADLLNKTSLWKKLNYIRVGIFIAVSFALIPLLLKLVRANG